MTATLHPEVNFDAYLNRMDSASEKTKILDYLNPGNVLDYGSGSGGLAVHFDPKDYVGYDLSPKMVEVSSKTHPGYTFTTEIPADQKFDNVMFCSLLHEVYSYNNFSYAEVVKVLKDAKSRLAPNGSIVIRDGIQSDSDSVMSFELVDPEDASKFLDHLNKHSDQTFLITIFDGRLVGLMQDIRNFLNIYTWGWASVEREMNERVNFATKMQWKNMLYEAGFLIDRFNEVVQTEYFAHLGHLIDLNGHQWNTKVFIKAH